MTRSALPWWQSQSPGGARDPPCAAVVAAGAPRGVFNSSSTNSVQHLRSDPSPFTPGFPSGSRVGCTVHPAASSAAPVRLCPARLARAPSAAGRASTLAASSASRGDPSSPARTCATLRIRCRPWRGSSTASGYLPSPGGTRATRPHRRRLATSFSPSVSLSRPVAMVRR